MLKEEYLQQLLQALYEKDVLNVYDHTAGCFSVESDVFANAKAWSGQLVKDKLAIYADVEHACLQITNFGKYWILKGGYEIFLKDAQNTKDLIAEKKRENDAHKEKEALLEARLRLTHYRIVGFWLMIVVSSLSFVLSLYNLFLIMNGKKW